MELGAFSISLAVKDLAVSKAFYEKLGFTATGGDETYQIMINGTTIIGIFQGMFEGDILTFNPGLGQDTKTISDFTDVREIRNRLVESGVEMSTDTDPNGNGPAHIVFEDPDGNTIMVDQFFPRPGSDPAA